MNFAKLLRIPFLQKTSGQLFLVLQQFANLKSRNLRLEKISAKLNPSTVSFDCLVDCLVDVLKLQETDFKKLKFVFLENTEAATGGFCKN